MTPLIGRILKLSEEIENFPLGQCSPSDDPDKQTAYLYSFKDLVKRFISSAKRLDDKALKEEINKIDPNPEFITDAYDLKADIQGVIDYINDTKTKSINRIKEKVEISGKVANKLSKIILDCLTSESANNLPRICSGYSLADGSIEEAFKSKNNYVYSRISHLDALQIFELAKKMKGKYPNSGLDSFLIDITESDEIGLISEFENIKSVLIKELEKAKYIIWIAVSWFTDKDLANLLFLKSQKGINVQIILNDDEINSTLKEKLNIHFDVYWVTNKEYFKKLMHNKFCLIDLKTVIHGSYNWTNKAQYNDETISVIQNRNITEEFAEQFLKLKNETKR